jgi:hypothetical protein
MERRDNQSLMTSAGGGWINHRAGDARVVVGTDNCGDEDR